MSRHVQLDDPDRTIIRARYASRCITCGDQIESGERCAHARDHGVLCLSCLRRGHRPTWRGPRLARAVVVRREPILERYPLPTMPPRRST